MSCIVKSCKNSKNKKMEGISFHRFPKLPFTLNKWMKALNLEENWNFRLTNRTTICSKHFDCSDIMQLRVGSRKLLRPSAIPKHYIDNTEINMASSVDLSASGNPSTSLDSTCDSSCMSNTQRNVFKKFKSPSFVDSTCDSSSWSINVQRSILKKPQNSRSVNTTDISCMNNGSRSILKKLQNSCPVDTTCDSSCTNSIQRSILKKPPNFSFVDTTCDSSCSSNVQKSILKRLQSSIPEDATCDSSCSDVLESRQSPSSSQGSSSNRNSIQRTIRLLHTYALTPEKMAEKMNTMRINQKKYRQKLYRANKKIVKLKKEIASLRSQLSEKRTF